MGCRRTIGDLAELVRGNTYKSKLLSEADGPVLLGLGSIERNGGFKYGVWKHYPGESDPRILLHPGDVYVSLKDLTQACDLLGAVARVPEDIEEGRLTQDTVKIAFREEVGQREKDYVYWGLRTPQYRAYCKARGTGTTNMSLSRSDFLSWELPEFSDENDFLIEAFELIEDKLRINELTNGYLAAMCEAVAGAMDADGTTTLADISSQATAKVACEESTIDSYVSTESLLPDKGGRQTASALPATGKVTVYQPGDTLVSNIRPYFKKVWYADREGTCSGDVIVFRANEPELAPYLYSVLRSDGYFEHVMAGAKGTKMPRGDKKQMMQYLIAGDYDEEDLKILASMLDQISVNNRENECLSELRDAMLPKLMSGEIDVSGIELSTQPNNQFVHT